MAKSNEAVLSFKDGETTPTGPVYYVHYKIINRSIDIEGAISIVTTHGLRYGGDDLDNVRRVIAENCGADIRVGPITLENVMVLGWSAYASNRP
jgi:hypothetical protein